MRASNFRAALVGALAACAAVTGLTAVPAQAATKVTLTMKVSGCNGCTVRPVQASNDPQIYWRGKNKTVHDGEVSWTLRNRRTVGMSFEIYDSGAVGTGAVTNVVIAYAKLDRREAVSPYTAAHKKKANGCWAGTKRTERTLHVRVDRFADTYPNSQDGVSGYNIRPYLIRTAAHLAASGGTGAYSRTYRGSIGNQDAYYCSH